MPGQFLRSAETQLYKEWEGNKCPIPSQTFGRIQYTQESISPNTTDFLSQKNLHTKASDKMKCVFLLLKSPVCVGMWVMFSTRRTGCHLTCCRRARLWHFSQPPSLLYPKAFPETGTSIVQLACCLFYHFVCHQQLRRVTSSHLAS